MISMLHTTLVYSFVYIALWELIPCSAKIKWFHCRLNLWVAGILWYHGAMSWSRECHQPIMNGGHVIIPILELSWTVSWIDLFHGLFWVNGRSLNHGVLLLHHGMDGCLFISQDLHAYTDTAPSVLGIQGLTRIDNSFDPCSKQGSEVLLMYSTILLV